MDCEYRTQYPTCPDCKSVMNTAHICLNNRVVNRADPSEHKYFCIVHGKQSKHNVLENKSAPCLAIDPVTRVEEESERNLFRMYNSTPAKPETISNSLSEVVSHKTGVGTTEIRAIVADPPPEENS